MSPDYLGSNKHGLLIILCDCCPYRGATLIEAYRAKQMKIQGDHEKEILQKIKLKMDRIKATQQKLQQSITEPETHAQGNGNFLYLQTFTKLFFIKNALRLIGFDQRSDLTMIIFFGFLLFRDLFMIFIRN